MTYVGIRQLKAQLSKYVRGARGGEHIIITDHGKPVARLIKGFGGDSSVQERLMILAQEGLIVLPVKPWRPRKRPLIASRGRMASDIIIEDRR